MINIKELLFFIFGAIFIMFISPLIDECLSLLLTAMEVVKGRMNVTITELSAEIKNISEAYEPKENPIGFSYEEENKGE